ncbi:hypothetical protein BC938DRAFT_482224 [Jimgerdemannia flammicorona]|uniref:Uncharacterized protein n=1 Tax=Jimgerdemannia flammicorona TaxID=994334 RepID=A0A433QEF5_9FUNG|nr:hypothetical protein BC938DRAFT_482224 [Jimgerdemannia flammicorona]
MGFKAYLSGATKSASNRPPPLAGPAYATLTLGSEQQEHAQLDFNASSLDFGSKNLSVLASNQPEKTIVCDVNNQTAITEQQVDVNSASPNEIPRITSSKPSRKQRNKDKESPTSQSGLEVISASPKSQINPVEPSLKVTNSLKKQQQHQQLAANSTNDGRKVGTEHQRREPQDEKYKTVTQTEKDQKKNGITASNSRTNNSDTLQSYRGQAISASNSHAVNGAISSGGKKKKKDKSKSATANINDVSSVATSAQQQPDAKDFSIDVIQVDGHTHIKEGHDIDSTSSTSKLFSVDDILDRINGTGASLEASVDSKLTSVGESDAPLDFGLKFDIPSSIFYSPPPPSLVSTPSTPGGAATSNESFTPLSSFGGNPVSGASTPTVMTTTSLDELLSKDFGFSLPPLTSSAFAWSANGLSGNGNGGVPHVRSSSPASVEALEREVENARKEAAMLENRLKAVINKNRMAMLSQ